MLIENEEVKELHGCKIRAFVKIIIKDHIFEQVWGSHLMKKRVFEEYLLKEKIGNGPKHYVESVHYFDLTRQSEKEPRCGHQHHVLAFYFIVTAYD